MKLFSLLVFCIYGLTIHAQTPCLDGFAGEYPCNEVSLMAQMSIDELGGATGLNDIWGWTDSLNCKEYALVGKENGTAFVDVTDPLNPCYLGTLPTHTAISTWRDIKVFRNYAFIVSEAGEHGMQVFDLTRLRDVVSPPTEFTEDAHYDGFGSSHNIAINTESGFAYPIGTSQVSGGPLFVNIQDPLNPIGQGGYSDAGYSHDAQIINYIGPDTEHVGKEIFFGMNGFDGKIVAVDVSDKTDPELIGQGFYPNAVYSHQGWITQDHRYFLHNDEIDEGTFDYNTRTRVWDLADLDNPIELPFFEAAIASSDHNHYIKGDYVFQSNYTGGLRILDISGIATNDIFETAYFDVHPSDDFNGYSGSWSNYPYFASGNVVVTHRQDGLFIVRPDDAAIIEATHPVYSKTCDGTIGGSDEINTACNPLSIESYSFESFQISPNPATDLVRISSENYISTMEVTDITGKTVMLFGDFQNTVQAINIDVSNLESGIYLLRLNGDLNSAQRFIIE